MPATFRTAAPWSRMSMSSRPRRHVARLDVEARALHAARLAETRERRPRPRPCIDHLPVAADRADALGKFARHHGDCDGGVVLVVDVGMMIPGRSTASPSGVNGVLFIAARSAAIAIGNAPVASARHASPLSGTPPT